MAMQRPAADLSKTSSSRFKHNPTADISWMMLDRFVFRRDDDDGSFPDKEAAPLRAKSSTSLGARFVAALLPAAPPDVSRLYVRWARDPGENVDPDDKVTELLTAHRHLFLLRTTCRSNLDKIPYQQDYFVFNVSGRGNSWLKRLPPCTEPIVQPMRGKKQIIMKRMFDRDTIGLVRGSGSRSDEFIVVQLAKFADIPGISRKGAELCVFRSRVRSSISQYDDVVKGSWEVLTLPINYTVDEFSDLQGWSTDGAVSFNNSVCWVDYHHGGILLYTPSPPAAEGAGDSFISYIRLPIHNRPNNSLPSQYPLDMYRTLCVTGLDNEKLRFIDVSRKDDAFFGPIKDGSRFTITCHTYTPSDDLNRHEDVFLKSEGTYTPSDDLKWHEDAFLKSDELWHPKSHKSLIPQNAVTTFPLVSMDKPHLVHFLVSEPGDKIDKVSLVVIDIITKKAISVSTYIKGEEDLYGEHADMVMCWSGLPRSLLPCQL